MLTFETRDGEVIATMKRCALTAAKDEGWTVFDGPLDAEAAAYVIIASNSGDLLVLLGDKRSQVFLMPP